MHWTALCILCYLALSVVMVLTFALWVLFGHADAHLSVTIENSTAESTSFCKVTSWCCQCCYFQGPRENKDMLGNTYMDEVPNDWTCAKERGTGRSSMTWECSAHECTAALNNPNGKFKKRAFLTDAWTPRGEQSGNRSKFATEDMDRPGAGWRCWSAWVPTSCATRRTQ